METETHSEFGARRAAQPPVAGLPLPAITTASAADERATGRQATPFTRAETETQAGTVSSLEKLGEQLALVLTKLAESQTALARARHRIGESGQTLAAVVDEHTHPDLSAGIPAYREAWSTTTETSQTLVSVDKTIRTYMTSIGAPGAETAGVPSDDEASPPMVATPSSENTAQPDQPHESTPEFGSPQWLAAVGKRIPPSNNYSPTRAIAFDDHGNEIMSLSSSTEQELGYAAQDFLTKSKQFPPVSPPGSKIDSTDHAETKLAMWLRQQRERGSTITHMTVVINHPYVCGPPLGCQRAVRALLPREVTMTVVSAVSQREWPLKGVAPQ
ncbi:SCP1.201-like deaminase [Actinopolyspora alba]|uniref:SCP1.201-like deaminase n=1 Tax=Actinopolyspora alba TaxID=673379 RepID=A0A1I2BR87_9ACTN|nr:DddA-like double-stranded DNA deaminase toxin [Actinopolyspora alba]SFE57780.1 SCP1.201-like deaminase [Actinopolyspora alba]